MYIKLYIYILREFQDCYQLICERSSFLELCYPRELFADEISTDRDHLEIERRM
jgi:hypothetical protein